VERLSLRQAELDQALAKSDIYEDANKADLKKLLAEKAEVDMRLGMAEESWIEAGEELERINLALEH
jgi:hypothetical protein